MANKAPATETPEKAPANVQPAQLKGLMSRLNHPVTITYGEDTIVIPPRGRIKKVNPAMLGTLPKGVIVYDPNVQGGE